MSHGAPTHEAAARTEGSVVINATLCERCINTAEVELPLRSLISQRNRLINEYVAKSVEEVCLGNSVPVTHHPTWGSSMLFKPNNTS